LRKRISFIIVFICVLWLSCSHVALKDSIQWVTVEDIAQSLEKEPQMNIAFDIDDTLLFSSPGYYYGQHKYSPGSEAYLIMEEFWNEMNNGLDRFSLPKECGRKLIELHKKRGDSIYFITARNGTKTERVTEILAETFGLKNPNKVIFTGSKLIENPKIRPIREYKIRIYYGDSDVDIKAAQAAGIRAIRIIRAGNSTNKPLPKAGRLGEEVLMNSEY
jgi:acid phosphatase (class B)